MYLKITIILISLLLLGCNNSEIDQEEKAVTPEAEISRDEMIVRHIESQLDIPGTEKYSFKIHEGQFDEDMILDAVILVNREEYATVGAAYTKQTEAFGFVGNFNYLFYLNGAANKVSRPIAITSTARISLLFSENNIQSDRYKDFTIDYRLAEGGYRNYYTIKRGVPILVFQWPLFDFENPNESVVNYLELGKGSYSEAKDILVYDGKINANLPDNKRDSFGYIIEKNGPLVKRFYYLPSKAKYFTDKK